MRTLKILLFVLLFSVAAFAQGNTTKIRTVTSLPATCTAGDGVQPADSVALVSGGATKFYICSATNTWTQVGGASAFNAITSGANTTANMQVGAGGQLSTLNTGQNAGNQVWLPAGLSAPTTSCSNTGGTINSGQSIQVAYTLNSALGETLSSVWVTSGVTTGCSGGTVSITINAPTLPTGYTGWTAYYCNGSGAPSCTAPVQVASCINITGNCVITSSTNGTVALPTVNTAWIQPPGVQVANPGITSPPGWVPSLFHTRTDGNNYPDLGIDASACSPLTSPCGIPTWVGPFFINDTGTNFAGGGANFGANNGVIKNNPFGVAHLVCAGTTCTSGFDDRAVGIRVETNSNMSGANNPRVLGIYGETVVNGSPTALAGNGPDKGAIGIRWTIADDRNTAASLNSSPLVAVDGSYQFTPSSGTSWGVSSCQPCAIGVRGVASLNANNINGGGSVIAGMYSEVNGSSGGSNVLGVDFYAARPSTVNPQLGVISVFAPGPYPTGAGNFFLRSDTNGLVSLVGGEMFMPSLGAAAGTITVDGALSPKSITTSQLAAPSASNACHTAGSTSYQFILVARDSNSGGVASSTININNCKNDVNATDYLVISSARSNGASSYDLWFTNAGGGTCNGGACTLGKVASCTPAFVASSTTPSCSFTYTGAAGDTTSPPTTNTTGGVVAYNFGTLTNCTAVGTAASPSVAACGSASAGAVACDVAASAATCTINTTAVTANSEIFVTEVSDEGTRLGVTCNTAPTAVPAMFVATKTANTSFVINMPTITVNPACFDYYIVN